MSKTRKWLYMFSLIVAGESIYMLVYMRRTFQTSMEEVFHLTSTQVGFLSSMFGILALICYFPGGWLADHFSSRKLLTFSLVATGVGGLYMLTIPGYYMLLSLFGFWGITTILTFWAALVKATRNWGTPEEQGTGFGVLDGGRGLVAALLATTATVFYAWGSTPKEGLIWVIWVYSLGSILSGLIVWYLIPEGKETPLQQTSKNLIVQTLKFPQVWLMAIIIFSSYILFIGTFEFPAFAEKGFEQTKVFGAQLGAFRDWLRPLAAVGAGLLADRVRASRAVGGSFVLLLLAYSCLFFMPTSSNYLWALWIEITAVAVAVFALRGIYFALLEEGGVPKYLTGTAVGFVSVIGFAPDVFIHVISGWFIDSFPGVLGYQYYFGCLALVAVMGLAAVGTMIYYEDYKAMSSQT